MLASLRALFSATAPSSPLVQTLAPAAAAALALQTVVALPSVLLLRSERFYDLSGATTFVLVAWLTFWLPAARARDDGEYRGGRNWRQGCVTTAVVLWAVRCKFSRSLLKNIHLGRISSVPLLGMGGMTDKTGGTPYYHLVGAYLFWRVMREGKDARFDAVRRAPRRFFAAFALQAAWVLVCVLPAAALNAAPDAALAAWRHADAAVLTDRLGAALYLAGTAFEAVADWQLARWRREKEAKVHREAFLAKGLWALR